MILSKIESNEMGLKLLRSWVDPPLCKGIIFCVFKTSGNIPEEKERFKIRQRGKMIRSTTDLSNFKGILAGPIALLGRA